MKMVGGTGIIGQDIVCGFRNGKYKTFEGTEIAVENCIKAKVKDLVVEGKTYQNLADNIKLIQGTVNKDIELEKVRVASEDFYLPSKKYTIRIFDSTMEIGLFCPYISPSVNFKQWTSDCIVWDNNSESNNIRITIRKKDKSAITVDEVAGKIVLLEGDYTNIDLPNSINGIESVAERENNILSVKINDNITTLNLPIPLRSLPNNVCDTIEGNKLVQRVGKVTLDENTEFNFPTSLIMANTVLIGLTISSIPKVYDSTISAICDKLQFKNIYNLDESGFFIDKTGTKLWLRLSISIYGSTLKEIKTNLALNPITIYYPLATPIIHNLEIPQLATTKGTNIITTTNNIKPKLSMKVKVK